MKKMTEKKRKKLEKQLAMLQANSISFRYNFGDEFDGKSNKYVAEFLLNNDYYSDMTDDDLIALIFNVSKKTGQDFTSCPCFCPCPCSLSGNDLNPAPIR